MEQIRLENIQDLRYARIFPPLEGMYVQIDGLLPWLKQISQQLMRLLINYLRMNKKQLTRHLCGRQKHDPLHYNRYFSLYQDLLLIGYMKMNEDCLGVLEVVSICCQLSSVLERPYEYYMRRIEHLMVVDPNLIQRHIQYHQNIKITRGGLYQSFQQDNKKFKSLESQIHRFALKLKKKGKTLTEEHIKYLLSMFQASGQNRPDDDQIESKLKLDDFLKSETKMEQFLDICNLGIQNNNSFDFHNIFGTKNKKNKYKNPQVKLETETNSQIENLLKFNHIIFMGNKQKQQIEVLNIASLTVKQQQILSSILPLPESKTQFPQQYV